MTPSTPTFPVACVKRTDLAAHPRRVTRHYAEVGADERREIRLVDDEEIGLGDPWPALPGNLVAARHVDHVDRVVGKIAAELGGKVVSAAFHEQQLRTQGLHQQLEGDEIRTDVVTNGRMRAATGLDGADPLGRQRLVPGQKLRILLGKDVVGHDAQLVPIAQMAAEREQQRRLAAADGTANAHGVRPGLVIASFRAGALTEHAGVRRVAVVVRVWRVMEDGLGHDDPPGKRGRVPPTLFLFSRLKQTRVQTVVGRLAQIDERRRLRDVQRPKVPALFDDAIDIVRQQRLKLLSLIGANQSEPDRSRTHAAAGQEKEQTLRLALIRAKDVEHGAEDRRMVHRQAVTSRALVEPGQLRARKRSHRAR